MLEKLESTALQALAKAYEVHERLGVNGECPLGENRFGDTALAIDVKIEEIIIHTFEAAGIPIRFVAEEHGVVDTVNSPVYLAILDGLDGSLRYQRARGQARYGTMLGLFTNLQPRYADYVFSGVMEHSTNRLFYAAKGRGSFVRAGPEIGQLRCSACTSLNADTRIYIDADLEANQKFYASYFERFQPRCLGASSAYYADIALGEADLVLECTRKSNLELAAAYGLVIESGGTMVTGIGETLAQKRYWEFGQGHPVPVLTASTQPLAHQAVQFISRPE